VQLAERARDDEGYSELLEVRCCEDAGLHVLPDHDRRAVEVGDVQVSEYGLLGRVRRDQVGPRVLAREFLCDILVEVYPEHLVVEGEQRV
jgi:hypothetical protein